MIRWALAAAAASGLAALAIGAAGAHALGAALAGDVRTTFDTAWQYHLGHALAGLAGALAPAAGASGPWSAAACACWLAGTAVFSGSLYVLVLGGVGWAGAITPVGGLLLLAGWACVGIAALRAG